MVAYVDSSILVAIAFDEPGAVAVRNRLREFDVVLAANLVEAELRSVCRRERREVSRVILDQIEWIYASRPLGMEIARVLEVGYVRGADCFHLANALFLAPDGDGMVFLTLDKRQRDVAAALGFAT